MVFYNERKQLNRIIVVKMTNFITFTRNFIDIKQYILGDLNGFS